MLRDISFQEIIKINNNQKGVIICGAGKDGAIAGSEIERLGIDFCFCDANKKGKYQGKDIISPKEIFDVAEHLIVIASRKYDKEIYIDLLERGINSESIFSLSKALNKHDQSRLNKILINGLGIEMHWPGINAVETFCMYNRFQSYLAEMAQDGYIVDIGANVGDTAAWMIPSTKGKMLCIEPVKQYYELLEKNIASFPKEFRQRIKTKNVMIVDDVNGKYALTVDNGTAIMKEDEGTVDGSNIKTLYDVLVEENIELKDVEIIKTDTDGNDYRCIMSMGETLKNIAPILYFENGIEDETTFRGFSALEKYLTECGYENFWFFDNFGNYICSGGVEQYHSINQYSMRMLKLNTGRTFFYTDIMACKYSEFEKCNKAVSMYSYKYSL